MPKRSGVKLDQKNLDALEVADTTTDGTFQKASEDVLQTRRIVRAKRQVVAPTTADTPSSSNPFAQIKIPVVASGEPASSTKPSVVEASTKTEAASTSKIAEDETSKEQVTGDAEEVEREDEKAKEDGSSAKVDGKPEEEEAEKDETNKRAKTEPTTPDDKPSADNSQYPFSFGQTSSSSSTGFFFGAKSSGFSFGNATGFGMIAKTPGKDAFTAEAGPKNTFAFHQPSSATKTSEETVKDTKILPETFEVQTGEEEEDCLMGPMKCKIFKYVPSTKSAETAVAAGVPPSKSNDDEEEESKTEEKAESFVWKSFGIGEIKILQHQKTKSVRIVQRNGPTVVLNERLKDSVEMTIQSENELRLKFADTCNLVALKVNKGSFTAFAEAIRPHVSSSD